MTVTEIMLSAIRTQVCSAERVEYGELSEEVMRSLYGLSKSHDMAHIVSAELDAQGLLKNGDEISEKFRKQHMIAIFRYERINYELEEICTALENAKIQFIPLKGSIIRKYYPEPWMRTSCDIDVLVRPEDLDRATKCIQDDLGYDVEGKGSHDVSMFSPSGVHVELHYDLVEEDIVNNCCEILKNAWDYAAPISEGTYRCDFSDAMFYFYHIAHMAKHFEHGGCGVRPLLDLWILDKQEGYDAVARDALLESGALLKFTNAARSLASVWFNGAEHTETTSQMEQYLLFGGVYGNMENRVALQQQKKGGKFKYIVSRIFLPYSTIKFHYPILQKHRWLTPVMQVRRWFKLIFRGGLKRSINEINVNAKMSDDKKESATELLERIGL
ncbi:MAG: nucleotidyltransferase family protein [Clostridia bacterium]|nr:nucleotidyltransferase family protein [Clostridia bacterium]